MKKIVFGLLLTAGVSGMSYSKEAKKTIIKDGTCTLVTVITVYDSCGNRIGTNVYPTLGSGNQCNGAQNGVKVITKDLTVEGCVSQTN